MIPNSPLISKSYAFSLRIIHFCKFLEQKREYVLSKQLLKSGTSIGANIEEAMQGQSRDDFISKLSISLKEAQETQYWLRLLRDSSIAPRHDCENLIEQVTEIIRLFVTSIKTAKSKR